MKNYIRTLTIAGSDSGGGAGIQADLKTFAALGCFGMSAITALTAQNTCEVTAIHPTPATFVGQQINAITEDIGVDAIKIGMLHNETIIDIVHKSLQQLKNTPIIIDPVMISTSGHVLLEKTAICKLKKNLFPLASLVTPNLSEAELLINKKLLSRHDIELAAKTITSYNCAAALITGGHLKSNFSSDCLYIKNTDEIIWLEAKKIITENTHGTGCTLAAAITSYLAQGKNIKDAVKHAKDYLTHAIIAGSKLKLGKGHGPVNHFYAHQ